MLDNTANQPYFSCFLNFLDSLFSTFLNETRNVLSRMGWVKKNIYFVHVIFPNCMKNQKTVLQLSNGALYAVYSRFFGGLEWKQFRGVYFPKKSFPLLCFENHSPPLPEIRHFCNLFRVFFLVDLWKINAF